MKKAISLIILALLPMVTSLQIRAYDFQSGGIYYSILSNNTVSVSPGNANYSGNVVIPSSVKYNGITYNVTTIANSAFLRCSGLTNVTIPNSVTYIGTNAFNSCSGLTSVTIPNSVETIAEKGFAGCSRLTSVTIGSGVSLIGPSAFNDCNSLKSVHITDLAAWCKILFDYDGPYQVVNPLELAHHLYMNNTEIKDLIIPQGVTSISDCAFRGCSGLTSVTIPNSVTSIGNTAFDGCIGLTSITIPNSLTSIGSYAFSDTGWYNNQSDGILYLNKWVICYKGDKNNFTGSVSIAEGTKGIADDAFSGCSGLTSVTIPNSLTSIGSRAFSGCSGLTSITIPNSVTSIGYNAFYNTGWYKNQSDGILYLNKWVISYKGNCSGSLSIAEGTKGIAESAFYYCSGLTSVTIPNSVTIIRSQAFYGCYSLTSIVSEIKNPFKIEDDVFYSYYDTYNTATLTVPAGTKSLYQSTAGWKKFKNIVEASGGGEIGQVFEVNGIYYIIGENNTVSVTSGDTKYNGDVTIPEQVYYSGTTYSVKTIGVGAFEACRSLTSITIPSSISSIEYDAFYSCISLTSVHITDLEAWCKIDFSNADSQPLFYAHHLFLNGVEIEDLTIPNSVTSIKDKAFYSCSGLTSVTIPNSVTSIEGLPFSGCSSLISIVSEIKNPFKIEDDVFYSYDKDIYATATLTVPAGTKSLYQSTAGWNKFKNIVEASGGGEIGQVFEVNGIYYKIGENNTVSVTSGDTKYIGDITIPEQVYYSGTTYSVTSIEPSAFYYCSDLTSVSIPNSVTTIGEYAFEMCVNLSSVNIPNGVTSLKGVFNGCSSLTHIIIPNTVVTIGNFTFGTSGLTSVTIPNSVMTIGESAFKNCKDLTNITIGDCVTTIGDYAFNGCNSLISVNIPNSVESLGRYAFRDCISLTSAILSNSVKSIEYRTFSGCSSLTSVNIPNSVESIDGYAFSECSSLSSITIPNSVKKIVDYAFYGCRTLQNVISEIVSPFKIPDNVFERIASGATLTVPVGTKSAYQSTAGWSNFQNIVEASSSSEETVVTFNIDGVTYEGSKSQGTAVVKSVDKNLTSVEIPASVSYDGMAYQVTGVADNAFDGCNMGALIWNLEIALSNNSFRNAVIGSNFLLYVKSTSYAPSSIKNVVVNGTASSIVLSGEDEGGRFYCPQAFTARSISYTHNYSMETGGNGKGWETLVLPFDVQKISHSTRGEIVPFPAYSSSSNKKPFWLATFSGSGFRRTSAIMANEPYIIAMPNSSNYNNNYILAGDVTFSAENVQVPKTPSFSGNFLPTYATVSKSTTVHALNVNNRYVKYSGDYEAGSLFISNLRDVRPFEAYIYTNSTRGIFEINIDDGTTDMEGMIFFADEDSEITINTLSGQLVGRTNQHDFDNTWNSLSKGVYIINGKKLIK